MTFYNRDNSAIIVSCMEVDTCTQIHLYVYIYNKKTQDIFTLRSSTSTIKYAHKKDLKAHLKAKHTETDGNFKCSQCPKSYPYTTGLQKHVE
jgi:hypothetical protein